MTHYGCRPLVTGESCLRTRSIPLPPRMTAPIRLFAPTAQPGRSRPHRIRTPAARWTNRKSARVWWEPAKKTSFSPSNYCCTLGRLKSMLVPRFSPVSHARQNLPLPRMERSVCRRGSRLSPRCMVYQRPLEATVCMASALGSASAPCVWLIPPQAVGWRASCPRAWPLDWCRCSRCVQRWTPFHSPAWSETFLTSRTKSHCAVRACTHSQTARNYELNILHF